MDSSKQIAGGITFLLCAAIVVFLMLAKLAWDPARPWPPKPDPYIEMAIDENFVEIIELPKPKLVSSQEASAPAQTPVDLDEASQLAPESGTALANAGKPGESPAKVVTTDRTSSVQTEKKEQPKNPGPKVDTEKQRKDAIAKQTENKVAHLFDQSKNNKGNANNKNKDEGKAGRTEGNPQSAGPTTSKSTEAGVSVSGLGKSGWKAPAYSNKIPSNEVGHVVFEVAVNIDGSIAKITKIGGKGLSDATIARCEAEIKRHKFTPPNSTKPILSITARVVFRFTDPK